MNNEEFMQRYELNKDKLCVHCGMRFGAHCANIRPYCPEPTPDRKPTEFGEAWNFNMEFAATAEQAEVQAAAKAHAAEAVSKLPKPRARAAVNKAAAVEEQKDMKRKGKRK